MTDISHFRLHRYKKKRVFAFEKTIVGNLVSERLSRIVRMR